MLLRFEVEDTGIGIAPEDHERIFKPFEQVAQAGRQKGTGLGLAITRQLIELMGGTIKVDSILGKGSCFRVELPAGRAQEAETKPEIARARTEFPVWKRASRNIGSWSSRTSRRTGWCWSGC